MLSHDALDRLASVEHPTLAIAGAQDQIIPAKNIEIISERIPGARLELIDNAGHLFFMEKPEQTLEVLDAFLSD